MTTESGTRRGVHAGSVNVLFVCTGNLCRSPIAEQLLRARIAGFDLGGRVRVASAGLRAHSSQEMPAEAAAQSIRLGGRPDHHRTQRLSEGSIADADLVLAMDREQRAQVVRMLPARARDVYTLREFARLADALSVGTPDGSVATRLRRLVTTAGLRRSMLGPLEDPADYDIADPYRRSEREYAASADLVSDCVDRVLAAVGAVELAAG